jgi:hypothetical protein
MSSAQHREEVWRRAVEAGNGIVYCNLCHCRVHIGDDWHESHSPIAKTFGGTVTGVAHLRCNVADNVEYVIPAAAQARRRWRRHNGITGPGLGDDPLPGGKRSNVTKTFRHGVKPRRTGKQKHDYTMAVLWPFGRLE